MDAAEYFLPKPKDMEEKDEENKCTMRGGCWTSHSQGHIQFGGWNTDAYRDSMNYVHLLSLIVKTMVNSILINWQL